MKSGRNDTQPSLLLVALISVVLSLLPVAFPCCFGDGSEGKGKERPGENTSDTLEEQQICDWGKQLEDARFQVRQEATENLYRTGTLAVPTILTLLQSKEVEVRLRARSVVKRWSEDDDAPQLRIRKDFSPEAKQFVRDIKKAHCLFAIKWFKPELSEIPKGECRLIFQKESLLKQISTN